jgi:hypothetical protein
MCQVQQAGLLRSLTYFDLEFVARLTELTLDAASNGAEPRN